MSVRMMMQGRAGSGAWTPASIDGLGLWLDAAAITGLVDGDPVSTWTNDGSAGDATQSSTARPLYKTGIVNGLPVVRFDGVDDWMSVADHTDIEMNANSTAFAVVVRRRSTPGGTYGAGIVSKDAGATSAGAYYWYVTQDDNYPRLDRPYIEGGLGSPTAPPLNTACMMALKVSGTTATHYLNGTSTATDTIAAGTANNNALRVGAFSDGALKQFAQFDFGELLIYNSALSDTDRAAVEDYLSAKWGTP